MRHSVAGATPLRLAARLLPLAPIASATFATFSREECSNGALTSSSKILSECRRSDASPATMKIRSCVSLDDGSNGFCGISDLQGRLDRGRHQPLDLVFDDSAEHGAELIGAGVVCRMRLVALRHVGGCYGDRGYLMAWRLQGHREAQRLSRQKCEKT